MRSILLIIALLFTQSIFAQDAFPSSGGRFEGVNGAGVALQDTWSIMQNQAGLARQEQFSAGAFLQNRFGLSELTVLSLAVVKPIQNQVVGLSVNTYGFQNYRRSRVGLAYARKLGEDLDIGVQMAFHQVQLGGTYGTSNTFTIEGGFRYQLNEEIAVAAHLFNPNRSQLSDFNSESIPSVIRTGISWEVSKKVLILAEVHQVFDGKVGVRTGLEYHAVEPLYIRLGAGSRPDLFSFGLGYAWNRLSIDVAASYEQILGVQPMLSLTYHAE